MPGESGAVRLGERLKKFPREFPAARLRREAGAAWFSLDVSQASGARAICCSLGRVTSGRKGCSGGSGQPQPLFPLEEARLECWALERAWLMGLRSSANQKSPSMPNPSVRCFPALPHLLFPTGVHPKGMAKPRLGRREGISQLQAWWHMEFIHPQPSEAWLRPGSGEAQHGRLRFSRCSSVAFPLPLRAGRSGRALTPSLRRLRVCEYSSMSSALSMATRGGPRVTIPPLPLYSPHFHHSLLGKRI